MLLLQQTSAVVDPGGGARWPCPPGPVKISHKNMDAKDGHIDFVFLGAPPPPYPAAGSTTALDKNCHFNFIFIKNVKLCMFSSTSFHDHKD